MELPLCGVRILLVDDDEDTRDLYTFALQQAGAEVRSASNADDAMRLLVSWPPTILLCDLALPGVDGCTFLRTVRALDGLRDVPAIAVTAMAFPRDRDAALGAGFHEHAAKPVTPEALIALVRRLGTGLRSGREGDT